MDKKTKKEIKLKYPTNFPDWSVGSGSFVVLQNRYYYEWKSYTAESEDQTLHDMKLTRLDSKTGKVTVVAEKSLSNPFIYLCKIDDEHFLSYYVCKDDPSKKISGRLSVAEIYDIKGNHKKIINEKYENQIGWKNSKGLLLERFSIDNGKIYGFGRKLISNEYKFFLHSYDINGKLQKTEELKGFKNIIKDEQPVEFFIINDYIIFRTFESLTSYICKKTDSGVDVIMQGRDGHISYSFIGDYILFIEDNITDNGINNDKEYPLYMLNTKNDKIRAYKLTIPLDNPCFIYSISLANEDLLLTYCNGEYDPLEKFQFLLFGKTLKSIFEKH